jgi:hypothetical protein
VLRKQERLELYASPWTLASRPPCGGSIRVKSTSTSANDTTTVFAYLVAKSGCPYQELDLVEFRVARALEGACGSISFFSFFFNYAPTACQIWFDSEDVLGRLEGL